MEAEQAVELLEGEHEDLVEEAKDVLGEEYAEYWLMSENRRFAGQRPIDFIQSEDPRKQSWARNVLRSIKYGQFT